MPVELVELAVGVAVGKGLLVLVPEQHQGHALAPQLEVHFGPVRHRAGPGPGAGLGEQHGLQGVVVQVSGQGPGETSGADPSHVLGQGGGGHPQAG